MSQTVPVEQGSIPASVRPHPSGDLSAESIHEEIKGWLEFITVNPLPCPTYLGSTSAEKIKGTMDPSPEP